MGQSTWLPQIDKFELDVTGLPPEIIKKVAFELYIRTVKRTRYKTGRARGNWFLSVGRGTSAPLERLSPGPSGSELGNLSGYRGQSSIFLVNNLSYIRYLEFGTQKFPGDHMLGRSVAEFRPIVAKMVREVQRGGG